jgi:hypothetical protein
MICSEERQNKAIFQFKATSPKHSFDSTKTGKESTENAMSKPQSIPSSQKSTETQPF